MIKNQPSSSRKPTGSKHGPRTGPAPARRAAWSTGQVKPLGNQRTSAGPHGGAPPWEAPRTWETALRCPPQPHSLFSPLNHPQMLVCFQRPQPHPCWAQGLSCRGDQRSATELMRSGHWPLPVPQAQNQQRGFVLTAVTNPDYQRETEPPVHKRSKEADSHPSYRQITGSRTAWAPTPKDARVSCIKQRWCVV